MKPSLQLRIGQSLAMTPQLQQAIKLLQLSSVELQEEIQEIFESNPMLEKEDEASTDEHEEQTESQSDEASTVIEEREINAEQEHIADELPVDSNWEDVYQEANVYSESPQEPARDVYENESSGTHSLNEHLREQFDLIHLSDTDRAIGITLIDEIDSDGYLAESIEEIYQGLLESFPELELDEVVAVQHLIQHLDPIGTCAQNLAECLSAQLQTLPVETPHLEAACKTVSHFIEALGKRDTRTIQRKLGLSDEDLAAVITLIQSLNPKPGAQISTNAPEYIIPDVSVSKRNNVWQVELNHEVAPKLRINTTYADMVKRTENSNDNNYMRTQLQEARWFIKSLQSRNETLLRVAVSIIGHQRQFLDYGPEAMKPLVLKDVADELELHESTVSRVTTNKYMHTPRGIFEFKYFFSSHVGTSDGGVCSATAIRAMIKKLIEEENTARPLSDSKIAQVLDNKGIKVARRTVAKYREALSIPSSSERKHL